MNLFMSVVLLLVMGGCAGPDFIVQPVEDDPSVFVGLARLPEGTSEPESRHAHPVQWSSADLLALLKRLAVQEVRALMDASRPAQSVFASEDLPRLVPALQQAFAIARPADWVVFAVWGASTPSQALEVTSGGLYLRDQQVHFLLANHRERVSSEEKGIHAIQQNPFRVLRDVQRRLLFFPDYVITETRTTWLAGGFKASVSELVLDYRALLEFKGLHHDQTTPPHTREFMASEFHHTSGRPSSAAEVELDTLQQEISTLKEENSRLRQQKPLPPAGPQPGTAP
ncbi:MAG: hypothetical protein R3B74_01715 [Nitrospirales bacterium]|nr:hypothetical protein [Nitrospirales bacterium]